MTFDPTPLTREEKLLAEQCVQLGNITEAVRSIGLSGNNSSLESKITELTTKIAALEVQNTTLNSSLIAVQALVSSLQQGDGNNSALDATPDTLQEVINHLNIELPSS